MIKRVAVRVALVMVLLVVLAAALPLGASAQTYIWGHVWEMSSYPDPWGNENWGQGVPGVQVLLKKNGVTIRQPTTTNENGDWGFQVSGVPGVYTVVVQMPAALVTPDGRSAFLFDGAVRLGQLVNGVPTTWTTIPGLVNPEYTFILVGGGQDPETLGPIDFLYTCSGAAPMVPPARQDGLPCYNPAWNRIYVHGVVKQVLTMNYMGNVSLQLLEEELEQDGRRTGTFVAAMRLVAGEIPTPITCVSAPPEEATIEGFGHWGMGFSYRPTWYRIQVTAGAVDADGLDYEFAYCEGGTNAQKEAANWPLMTPNNPHGEIVIWVQ